MRVAGGEWRGRAIRTVLGPGYRPATARVREAIFNMLTARGVDWHSARVVDVFAGSGSLAIEALSRGARFALFIEQNRKAAAAITRTLGEFGAPKGRFRVAADDYAAVLDRQPDAPFDVAFIDPPYGQGLLAPALDKLARRGYLAADGIVVAEIEAEAGFDPDAAPAGLSLSADKFYGQTRILVWINEESTKSV